MRGCKVKNGTVDWLFPSGVTHRRLVIYPLADARCISHLPRTLCSSAERGMVFGVKSEPALTIGATARLGNGTPQNGEPAVPHHGVIGA